MFCMGKLIYGGGGRRKSAKGKVLSQHFVNATVSTNKYKQMMCAVLQEDVDVNGTDTLVAGTRGVERLSAQAGQTGSPLSQFSAGDGSLGNSLRPTVCDPLVRSYRDMLWRGGCIPDTADQGALLCLFRRG